MPTVIDGANGVNNVAVGSVSPTELSTGGPSWDSSSNVTLGLNTANTHTVNGSISLTKDLALTGTLNQSSIVSVASAATVNLNTTTSNYVSITGTTTITSFTLSVGRERTLVFTGSVLLTNSATLILPGGINITTEPGDSLVVLGEAAGTRVLSYTRSELRPYQTFKAFYDSPPQTITAAGALSLTHGLGSTPTLISVFLQNVTAEAGYSPGDIVAVNIQGGDVTRGASIIVNSTSLIIRYASSAATYAGLNATTGGSTAFTNANWRAIFKAWA